MILLAALLGIVVTISLHAVVTTLLVATMRVLGEPLLNRYGTTARPMILATAACILAAKHGVDIIIWAWVFWQHAGGELADFETAVYFSAVTYTTLGYGDVVVQGQWRLLCGVQAINGMLLFGLSTALLFAIVERLWRLRES